MTAPLIAPEGPLGVGDCWTCGACDWEYPGFESVNYPHFTDHAMRLTCKHCKTMHMIKRRVPKTELAEISHDHK